MSDIIRKARQVGDSHPSKPWVWTEYKPGKFDWRPAGNKAIKMSGGLKDGDEDVTGKSVKIPKAGKPSQDSINRAKSAGSKKMQGSDNLADWATKTSEENLVKVVNNSKGNAQLRKIGFEELKNRGYDISQLNTSGTLEDLFKLTGGNKKNDSIAKTSASASQGGDGIDVDGNEEEGDEVTERWYLNKNDDRVKKKFNLRTKEGRIKYDQFLFKMKKKEPDYLSPVEVVQDLNEQYLEFLDNPEQRFMISAGGAGIGKTYGFNKMAELMNLRPFQEGDSPGDGDYDIFEASEVGSGKQLLKILKEHNGKIILFDDTDAVLTRKDAAPIMKKATATTGRRTVGDPDDIKSNFEFTGRIIIMTNKNLPDLVSENEDTKAVISRAMMVSEIYMTVPETIEVMESRFQDYEFPEAPRLNDPNEDKQERNDVLKLIKDNEKNIDPSQFTTRTFQAIINEKRKVDKANERRNNPAFAALIGSSAKDWKQKALAKLTKAIEISNFGVVATDIEKAEDIQEVIKAEDILFEGELVEDKKKKVVKAEQNEILKAENVLFDFTPQPEVKSDVEKALEIFGF